MKNNQIQRAYWALLHKIDEDVNYYFYELFREITMLPKSLQNEYLNNLVFDLHYNVKILSKPIGVRMPAKDHVDTKRPLLRAYLGEPTRQPRPYNFNQEFNTNCVWPIIEYFYQINNREFDYKTIYNDIINTNVSNTFITVEKIDPKSRLTNVFEFVSFLGLLKYYYKLVNHIIDKKPIQELKPEQKPKQLKTDLTDNQKGKLFDLLVEKEFISKGSNKDSFIWAFGGEKQPDNFEQIEWIDESTTRKERNMKTFYELLLLLGVPSDTKGSSEQNLYRKIEYCFKGFVNIQAKNTDCEVMGNTPRKRLLKEIVDQVTGKQKK